MIRQLRETAVPVQKMWRTVSITRRWYSDRLLSTLCKEVGVKGQNDAGHLIETYQPLATKLVTVL
jgi:hypothetical protein